jgi:hypothetical protein
MWESKAGKKSEAVEEAKQEKKRRQSLLALEKIFRQLPLAEKKHSMVRLRGEGKWQREVREMYQRIIIEEEESGKDRRKRVHSQQEIRR